MSQQCRIRLEADSLNELKTALADLQKRYSKSFTATAPQNNLSGGFVSYATLVLPEPKTTLLSRLHNIAEESALRMVEKQGELRPDENCLAVKLPSGCQSQCQEITV